MAGNTAIGRRVILKDLQGNYLLPYTDTGSGGNPDGKTIIKTDDPLAPEMVAVGQKTKDGQYVYDWYGTQEEYQEAVANGTIQPDWTCFITDDDGAVDVLDVTQLTQACSAETMLEGRYFEKPTFNPCWLLSDGNKKDGTIYKAAYDALIAELSGQFTPGQVTPEGYAVRGLSVKDSTATDITDFDFVVYQNEHKFKLPIATLKGCNSVNALYLYFYVGNTVTNLESVIGGQVLHSLDKKLERFDCDGQWVSKVATLSTATAVGTYTIDLSSYLPDDNYNYEVMINLIATCLETTSPLIVRLDIDGKQDLIVGRNNFISSTACLKYHRVIDSRRILSFTIRSDINITSGNVIKDIILRVLGYRRIGLNN